MGAKQNQNCDKEGGKMEKRLRVNPEGGAKWVGGVGCWEGHAIWLRVWVCLFGANWWRWHLILFYTFFGFALCHMKSNFHAWLLLLCVRMLVCLSASVRASAERIEWKPNPKSRFFFKAKKIYNKKSIPIKKRLSNAHTHTHTPANWACVKCVTVVNKKRVCFGLLYCHLALAA